MHQELAREWVRRRPYMSRIDSCELVWWGATLVRFAPYHVPSARSAGRASWEDPFLTRFRARTRPHVHRCSPCGNRISNRGRRVRAPRRARNGEIAIVYDSRQPTNKPKWRRLSAQTGRYRWGSRSYNISGSTSPTLSPPSRTSQRCLRSARRPRLR